MSLTEETQNLPIDSEVTPHSQEVPTIDWNRLQLINLRTEPERDFNLQKLEKGKAVEWDLSEDYDKRPLPPDELVNQSYAFLSHMKNRLEQKLEEKLGNLLLKVLDNSLQQWSAQLNKVSWADAAESSFSKKTFKKPRNQYKYNAVCEAKTMLQKAIQKDLKEKMTEVHELLKLRAFVLKVTEEEGWSVAAKISKPTSSEKDEFKELLTEARKQAKPFEGCPMSYDKGIWKSRSSPWTPGLRRNYYTLYPLSYAPSQHYAQYPPPMFQEYQSQNVVQNPSPAYQNSYNKQTTKQFNCYFCGGAGHMAAICSSKSTEGESGEQNNDNNQYKPKQGVVGRIHEPAAVKYWMKKNKTTPSSSLLAKKSSTFISEKCMESSRKRKPKTLQVNQLARKSKFLGNCKIRSRSASAWISEFRKYAERFLDLGVYRQSYASSDNKF
ncbi:1026_t:CDS:2 [Cetraspora pellucida]|uniref:1026_t:CDS:1 n=1 Tax=Cetraspora pellucida TaxID=1433469 RepID=A0A9N8VAC1_9GLOM|nr:1026_t:CDS:2 [Cetraspora pellucida]